MSGSIALPFAIELAARNVPHLAEDAFPIVYKGTQMPVVYRVDFVCFGRILVELKALPAIGPLEHAQVINYLKASKLQRALILNFGARSLQYKRVVWVTARVSCSERDNDVAQDAGRS